MHEKVLTASDWNGCDELGSQRGRGRGEVEIAGERLDSTAVQRNLSLGQKQSYVPCLRCLVALKYSKSRNLKLPALQLAV